MADPAAIAPTPPHTPLTAGNFHLISISLQASQGLAHVHVNVKFVMVNRFEGRIISMCISGCQIYWHKWWWASFGSVGEKAELLKEIQDYNRRKEEMDQKLREAAEIERHNLDLQGQLDCAKTMVASAEKDKELAIKAKEAAIREKKDEELLNAIQKFKHCSDHYEDSSLVKKPRMEKREFDIDGSKLVPAKYTEMNLEGLINIAAVDMRSREMIAKNEFFELFLLMRTDDFDHTVSRRTSGDSEDKEALAQVKAQQPKTRPELFQLLYAFGQYYLQCYPEKTAAFLEYMGFLSKYGQIYSVPILVKLENSIRRFYVQHPQLNWDITRPETQRMVRDADLEQSKLNAQKTTNKKQGSSQASFSNAGSSFGRNYNTGNRQFSNNQYGGESAAGGSDVHSQRCKNWNFKACVNNPKCFRRHVCWYCAGNHKASECYQRR